MVCVNWYTHLSFYVNWDIYFLHTCYVLLIESFISHTFVGFDIILKNILTQSSLCKHNPMSSNCCPHLVQGLLGFPSLGLFTVQFDVCHFVIKWSGSDQFHIVWPNDHSVTKQTFCHPTILVSSDEHSVTKFPGLLPNVHFAIKPPILWPNEHSVTKWSFFHQMNILSPNHLGFIKWSFCHQISHLVTKWTFCD